MRFRTPLIALLILGLLLSGGWYFHSRTPAQSLVSPVKTEEKQGGEAKAAVGPASGEADALNPAYTQIEGVALQLRLAGDQATRDELLASLREDLGNQIAEPTVAAVQAFLESGTDEPTGQQFSVDAAGNLESAPTLRTFLLDFLGQLSVPAAAGNAGLLLQSEPTSAAEWAVALRNYARGNGVPQGGEPDGFFQLKVHELLTHQGWINAPTPGFLYAMDAAVYSGDSESARLLAELATLPGSAAEARAVRTVAFDKLARIAYDDFASLAPLLESDPGFAALGARQRGTLYAYADVRDPAQLETIRRFLGSVDQADPTAEAFAATYPNFSLGLSAELLTETPPRDELDDIDAVLAAWEATKSWSAAHPFLVPTTDRLGRLVRSIEAGIADR